MGADGAEGLHSILQQVKEEDLLENNDLDVGDVMNPAYPESYERPPMEYVNDAEKSKP